MAQSDYTPEPNSMLKLVNDAQQELVVHVWKARSSEKGAVLFLHGLAEHAMRYAPFAGALTQNGWSVYAPDQRGHGQTAIHLGIAGDDGWFGMVRDAGLILHDLRTRHPAKLVMVVGYSMGSIVALRLVQEVGTNLQGAILLGTGCTSNTDYQTLIHASIEAHRLGREKPSELWEYTFKTAYNAPFQPVETPYDWLSRDRIEVKAYADDPLCGIPVSCGLAVDYIVGQQKVFDSAEFERIPAELPVLILNGLEDVSAPLEGVQTLIQQLSACGMHQVSWQLFPGARHDLLHETNSDQVIDKIICWLDNI